MSESPWPIVAAERGALADDLHDLSADRWASPSLCDRWTVHEVLAHLTATAKLTPARFVTALGSAGFRFQTFSDKGVAAEASGGPAATLAEFRAHQHATTAPPGPRDSWLGEVLVHAEDIRRPLGIAHDYPLPWVTRAIDFYSRGNTLLGGKRRVEGLALRATDTDWSHGSGAAVEGSAVALLLATTGRKAALDDLTGPGVELLRQR